MLILFGLFFLVFTAFKVLKLNVKSIFWEISHLFSWFLLFFCVLYFIASLFFNFDVILLCLLL